MHRAVARPRLFAALNRAGEHARVLSIIGPPGAGKTTLVSTWLRMARRPALWYQLDPDDRDLPTFFFYLSSAAAAFRRGNLRPLPMLTAEFQTDVIGFARRFFRALFGRLPAGTVLVLDNYQDVPIDAELHNLLSEAIGEVPEDVHVVLVSRNELPSHYARHLANEAISHLNWAQLRLDRDEVREIASGRVPPGTQEVDWLVELSDGWPAGLTLLLEGHQRQSSGPRTASMTSRQRVFDYFASQVFDVLPERTREVLITASLLPWIDSGVVATMSGNADAGSLLGDLHRRRLFIDLRGEGSSQYQFHPLFHEFLRRRADAAMSVSEREQSLRAAAQYLVTVGQHAELALDIMLEVGDCSSAATQISCLAPVLLGQGRWHTLVGWIDRLENQSSTLPPWMRYWHGMALMNTDLAESRAKLSRSADEFARESDGVGELLASAAVIRTYHYAYNTFEPVDEWIDRIARLLADRPTISQPDNELAIYSALVIAVTYRLPGHPLKDIALRKSRSLLFSPLDPNPRVSGALALVMHYALAQEFDAALDIVSQISPVAESLEITAMNRMFWWMSVGYLQHRMGNHAKADQAFRNTDRVARDSGLDSIYVITRCFIAYHAASWGDVEGLLRTLEGVEERLSASRPMLVAQYHLARLMAEMQRRDFIAAERHARKAVAAALQLGAPFFRVTWPTMASAALGVNGHHEEAEAWLATAWTETEVSFLKVYRPMITATRAYCRHIRGDREGCHTQLRQLLGPDASVDHLSYIRTFPLVKDELLAEALRAGIAVPLTRELIRRWELAAPDEDIPEWPWPVRVHTLGRFRIEVDGHEIEFGRKLPRKPMLLLKAIIAYGGREVPVRRLADAIWPDDDGDAAMSACTVALHRLRKLLAHANAIASGEGCVTVDTRICWVDAWALSRRLEQHRPGVDELVGLYHGPFLHSDIDATWAVPMREKLRTATLRRLAELAWEQELQGDMPAAVSIYRKGQSMDATAEGLYLGEMRCLQRLGRPAEALAVFNQLQSILDAEFGVGPSLETLRLAEEIRGT